MEAQTQKEQRGYLDVDGAAQPQLFVWQATN